MNKDSIYKLIGYAGEYNKEVKSKLRGLLKKYHPDHNQGKSEIFKLINEVKKELEGNQSKTKNKKETSKKDTDSNNEDFLYYEMKIQELSKQKEELEQKIKQKNKVIKEFTNNFCSLNENFIKNKEILYNNQDNLDYLKSFKEKYITYILSLIIAVTCYLIKRNIVFIGLVIIIVIILSLDVIKLYTKIKKINIDNNNYVNKNFELLKEIQTLKDKINHNKQTVLSLKRDLTQCENDIRFYQNRMKTK